MRQLNLSHLALRKGLDTFAYETTFRCSSASPGLAPQNRGAGRSTCVRTAQLEYMKRFGMAEMLSYILIAEAGIRLGSRSSAKHGVL